MYKCLQGAEQAAEGHVFWSLDQVIKSLFGLASAAAINHGRARNGWGGGGRHSHWGLLLLDEGELLHFLLLDCRSEHPQIRTFTLNLAKGAAALLVAYLPPGNLALSTSA